MGTYTNGTTYFTQADWLGTERARTDVYGNLCGTATSQPFGDNAVSGGCFSMSHNFFTGKERDSESGNDYFGARYYASSMGRFLSPDPLLNSGRPENPQTWNRYSYALNSPLIVTDPIGLYNLVNTCASDAKKCNKAFAQNAKNLKNAISALTSAVNGLKDGAQKTALQASLQALGTENDGNNVDVKFGTNADGAAGNTALSVDSAGNLDFTIALDPSKNPWDPSSGSFDLAINAAHEGTHVADDSDPRFANLTTTLSPFSSEYRGYRTLAYATSAFGQPSLSYGNGRYLIWNGSWTNK